MTLIRFALSSMFFALTLFRDKVKKLAAQLSKEFGSDEFKLTHEAYKQVNGKFEVSVAGKLVHSKASGDGFPDTKQKMEKIIKAMVAAGAKTKA
ncbi:hypothetical protein AAMO2058_000387200 [Amorphochlora amoebiformis]